MPLSLLKWPLHVFIRLLLAIVSGSTLLGSLQVGDLPVECRFELVSDRLSAWSKSWCCLELAIDEAWNTVSVSASRVPNGLGPWPVRLVKHGSECVRKMLRLLFLNFVHLSPYWFLVRQNFVYILFPLSHFMIILKALNWQIVVELQPFWPRNRIDDAFDIRFG